MIGRYVLVKVARSLLTLWLIVTFSFVVLATTGDPLDALVGDDAPQEVIDQYAQRYGFDRPLHEQYFKYLKAVATFDFGISYSDETPVADLILEALPKTLQLGLTSLVGGLLLGVGLGVLAAVKRNTAVDRFVMGFAVFGFSIPNFFFGILLILLFSLQLRLLPSAGSDSLAHLILPAVTLGTSMAGAFARFTRSAVLEVLGKTYMHAAHARGIAARARLFRHALPNAAIPLVTILGLRLGDVVAGAIVTESVFAWPGLGRLLVNAVSARELAVVMGTLIFAATSIILANLTVDLLYGWIDPRMRSSRRV